jgi:ADP-glucose pyrophosphorylase
VTINETKKLKKINNKIQENQDMLQDISSLQIFFFNEHMLQNI